MAHINANRVLSWRELGSQENNCESSALTQYIYSWISVLIKPTFSLWTSPCTCKILAQTSLKPKEQCRNSQSLHTFTTCTWIIHGQIFCFRHQLPYIFLIFWLDHVNRGFYENLGVVFLSAFQKFPVRQKMSRQEQGLSSKTWLKWSHHRSNGSCQPLDLHLWYTPARPRLHRGGIAFTAAEILKATWYWDVVALSIAFSLSFSRPFPFWQQINW